MRHAVCVFFENLWTVNQKVGHALAYSIYIDLFMQQLGYNDALDLTFWQRPVFDARHTAVQRADATRRCLAGCYPDQLYDGGPLVHRTTLPVHRSKTTCGLVAHQLLQYIILTRFS